MGNDSSSDVLEAMKRKSGSFEYFTDEEDSEPLIFKRNVRPSPATKLMACCASSSAASASTPKARVTGSGPRRAGLRPMRKYKIGMETEGNTARQAQRQMQQFASTVTELCTGFETSKMKNEELGEQVTDLEGQIQKWKDQKASWDVKKQELERERDEALKKALIAVAEQRNIEEKLEKATKQVDDAEASAKKAIYEAVAVTTRCYKNCLGNFVASLANDEGDSLKDYAKELVKEMLCGDRYLSDGDIHAARYADNGTIKDKAS